MASRALKPHQSLMEIKEREYRRGPAPGRKLYLAHAFAVFNSAHRVIWHETTEGMTESEAMEYASDACDKMLKKKLLIGSDGRPKTSIVINYIKDSVRYVK